MGYFIILLVIFARITEAFRDAESFERSEESRSFVWHAFKFPQFTAWVYAGWLTAMARDDTGYPEIVPLFIGVLLAWPIFNKALQFFRWMQNPLTFSKRED